MSGTVAIDLIIAYVSCAATVSCLCMLACTYDTAFTNVFVVVLLDSEQFKAVYFIFGALRLVPIAILTVCGSRLDFVANRSP